MATPCTNAPFINQNFYITGTWGENREGHIHAGLDLATGGSNPVFNMRDGYVIYQDPNGIDGSGYGPYVIIQSTDGTTWLYGDLSPFTQFRPNQFVRRGEYIGNEGNPSGTGSTGYHVHIELEMLTFGQSFKYGYANSSDPATPLGLPNEEGGPYIYIPNEPLEIKNNRFPWVLYARKLREKRERRR